ncbi:hypothetical protein [Butyrivibrio sp. AC2005]|uniref:hypothetical protein n=1 Tax=Butyrivibrio sp. AC2005 TaxID=1280672 RepID=UPI000478D607|nr:hypothetical protein [Butyrivibrio sp. AC2005]
MSYNPEREEKKKTELKTKIIWTLIASTYAGLYIGAEKVLYEAQNTPLLDSFSDIISDLYTLREVVLPIVGIKVTIPGALIIFPTDIGMVFIAILAGSLYCLSEYTKFVAKGKTRPGEEHGSSSFSTDYKTLTQNYMMSPKVLKQGLVSRNIKVSFFDYIRIKFHIHRQEED